ncbi:hypothetical protein [Trueperella pyogenes]|uniref:hypothetical protein n=1 Tax=Trueperella pyogenes TaxID=1661 RepID=UPI00046A4389|nr:hypothetical protein [Trueperella pyogenes]AWG04325.1 hypothetical protein DC090_07730 [Trueperella pyogenes]AWG17052.1 hypothetical protein DDE06_09660 [Trueperella pyogenes]AZR04043.1 hypothetical protein EBQ11_01475 [Trueperella pyogenes]MCI7688749.1 hypothetical protein [Trueperella pyogenes]QIU86638.1 hypothetical protein HEP79_04935 [Trueperella pyogenes]
MNLERSEEQFARSTRIQDETGAPLSGDSMRLGVAAGVPARVLRGLPDDVDPAEMLPAHLL